MDSNEQAARLSAELRADLVRLGRVDEHGVPLGLQGTYAGAGDLVQARLNGWHLAGYEGNRRVPINREQYRVLATRDDGGLVVAPILGRTADGEQLGERMTLPADYVGEHVALAYASTVHAAQGLTVDTSHAVITSTTGPEALYVGMSRGREANTAHVATLAVPDDAPSGEALEAIHRSLAAVLANTLEDARPERSALATAVESAAEKENVRTPAELLADAVDLATAGRTAKWLDQLVDDGHLTPGQRSRIAAEDGASSLNRILSRAELAGHDPQQVLAAAVADRPLDGARQLTNVIHHRITSETSLDPTGTTFADWTPRVDWSPTDLPNTTRDDYADTVESLGRALRLYRRRESTDSGTTTKPTNPPPCVCECGRRIRVATSVRDAGPITCGICGTDFEPEQQ